jgi:outer membrane receptor for monomeric catechols
VLVDSGAKANFVKEALTLSLKLSSTPISNSIVTYNNSVIVRVGASRESPLEISLPGFENPQQVVTIHAPI